MQSKIQPTVPSPPQAKTRKSGVSRKKFSLGSRRKAQMVLFARTFDTTWDRVPQPPPLSLCVCYNLDSFWGWEGHLIFWNQNLLSNTIEYESQEPSLYKESLTQHSTQNMFFFLFSITCAEESLFCFFCNSTTNLQHFDSPLAFLPDLSPQPPLQIKYTQLATSLSSSPVGPDLSAVST